MRTFERDAAHGQLGTGTPSARAGSATFCW